MAYDPWVHPGGPVRRALSGVHFAWRQATAKRRMAPDFLILGAMKAATTTLFDAIAQHPDFRGPLRKEIQYFSTERWRPWSWYLAHFPVQRQGTFTGEASPYYLYHPMAPGMVATWLPGVAPIAVLRDPIERAWSQYKYIQKDDDPQRFMYACLGEAKLGIDEARFQDPEFNSPRHRRETYLARSRYAEQLARWDRRFGHDRILVLTTDDLRHRFQDSMDRVAKHVGVAPWHPEPHERNTGRSTPLPADVRDRLWPLVEDDVVALRRRVPDLPW